MHLWFLKGSWKPMTKGPRDQVVKHSLIITKLKISFEKRNGWIWHIILQKSYLVLPNSQRNTKTENIPLCMYILHSYPKMNGTDTHKLGPELINTCWWVAELSKQGPFSIGLILQALNLRVLNLIGPKEFPRLHPISTIHSSRSRRSTVEISTGGAINRIRCSG